MKIAICPGSYDPVTYGHLDIIKRSAVLVDKLIVTVFVNPSKKASLFSIEERLDMLRETTKDISNVEVDTSTGLLNVYAASKNCHLIIRGLRAFSDFEYEFQRALMIKKIDPTLETAFFMTDGRYSYLSSTGVRELAYFNGDVSQMVPPYVEVPFSNKKMVDKDEIERLIDAINQSLPNELESARRIVADKERILLDAEKKADDTIAQAKDYIARITEESELVKQAQERANEVVTSANHSAEELRSSSVTYATDVLKYVETNMENMLDTLKKNRQSLIDSNTAAAREEQK